MCAGGELVGNQSRRSPSRSGRLCSLMHEPCGWTAVSQRVGCVCFTFTHSLHETVLRTNACMGNVCAGPSVPNLVVVGGGSPLNPFMLFGFANSANNSDSMSIPQINRKIGGLRPIVDEICEVVSSLAPAVQPVYLSCRRRWDPSS